MASTERSIRERHQKADGDSVASVDMPSRHFEWCAADWEDWPCEVAQVLALLDSARVPAAECNA